MGLLSFFIAIVLIAGAITYCTTVKQKREEKTIKVAMIWGLSLSFCIVFFAFISYCNSVGLYGQKAKIAQHRTALSLYTAYANVPTGAKNKLISDLTDQKYHNYQTYLDGHILALRRLVDLYNSVLVKKQIMKQGFLFGLFIHCPKDLKPIVM